MTPPTERTNLFALHNRPLAEIKAPEVMKVMSR
jgi:hypothetical protein